MVDKIIEHSRKNHIAQMEVLFDSQNVEEFFTSFCRYSSITLYIDLIRGKNSHHIAEAIFKAFARAIKEAISIDDKKKNIIPPSKGEL